MEGGNAALLSRLEALERKVEGLLEVQNEPLHAGQRRRIQKLLDARTCADIHILGNVHFNQPVLFTGLGRITIGDGAQFGYHMAPGFYSGYICIDARSASSHIVIGGNVHITNDSVLASEGEGIDIGNATVMGVGTEIYDTDFHAIDPGERAKNAPSAYAKTSIGRNVFIGTRCKIFKGVTIGDNSVIGGGSVVVRSIPPNVVAAGNPMRVIRTL